MIYLTFIRHGTTDVNGMGYIATNKDIPLNENGVKECESIRFKKGKFDKVYCSPTKRTLQTAKLIYPYVKAEITELLKQKEWGELTNHFKKEYDSEYISKLRNYKINPSGAESLDEVIARLNKFFEKIKKENKDESRILIVTHNGILRIVKKIFLNNNTYEETRYLECFNITLQNE